MINFNNFTRVPETFFNIIGLTPYFNSYYTRSASLIKNVFFFSSFIILLACLLGEFLYLYKSFGNFKNFLEMTELAPCMGFVILALVKMETIYRNREKLTVLMDSLEKIYPKNLIEQNKWDVDGYLKDTLYLMKTYSVLYQLLIWMFNLTPLGVAIFKYFSSNDWNLEMPYFIWYPFNVNQPWIFELNYLIQIWAGFTSANAMVGTDLLFCGIITLICMQFEILQKKLRKLEFRGSNATLYEYVKIHTNLIQLSNDLDTIYSPSLLVNFFGSSLIICLVGFQVTAGVAIQDLFKFCLFLVSSLGQIVILCWYGNKVIVSSSGISDAIYESKWYDGDTKYKRSVALIIHRGQKPQKLTAFKFAVVSVQSLGRILSTSYSYFTLLRTVYDPSASALRRNKD